MEHSKFATTNTSRIQVLLGFNLHNCWSKKSDGFPEVESSILNMTAAYLGVNISYLKYHGPSTYPCQPGNHSKGIFDHLINNTCDVVIGTSPCVDDTPSFDLSVSHMEDGSALVVPTANCPRFVGLVQIRPQLALTILGVFLALSVIGISLLRSPYKTSFQSIIREQYKTKFFVLFPLLSLLLLMEGLMQGTIYHMLVCYVTTCQAKNVDDILARNMEISVEAFIFDDLLDTTFKSIDKNQLRKYWRNETDVESMDLDQSHILRELVFKYLLANVYTQENGAAAFKLVQIIKRVPYNLFLSKNHPLLEWINEGIMLLQQSGISGLLIEKSLGYKNWRQIVKRSQIQSQFTPVKIQEIWWLIMDYLVCLFISVLLFLIEVSINRLTWTQPWNFWSVFPSPAPFHVGLMWLYNWYFSEAPNSSIRLTGRFHRPVLIFPRSGELSSSSGRAGQTGPDQLNIQTAKAGYAWQAVIYFLLWIDTDLKICSHFKVTCFYNFTLVMVLYIKGPYAVTTKRLQSRDFIWGCSKCDKFRNAVNAVMKTFTASYINAIRVWKKMFNFGVSFQFEPACNKDRNLEKLAAINKKNDPTSDY